MCGVMDIRNMILRYSTSLIVRTQVALGSDLSWNVLDSDSYWLDSDLTQLQP